MRRNEALTTVNLGHARAVRLFFARSVGGSDFSSAATRKSSQCRMSRRLAAFTTRAWLVLQASGLRVPVPPQRVPLASLDERVAEFAKGAGTVLVDADNVRGKGNFELSHAELIRAVALWGRQRGLDGRVVVGIDHGSSADAWYLRHLGLAVCFAGPDQTADDLIARAVPCFANTLLVTADSGLTARCRSAAKGGLQVIAACAGLLQPDAYPWP